MAGRRVAAIFPGQGLQYIGMGKDLAFSVPKCREALDEAEEVLKYRIRDVMFDGSEVSACTFGVPL